MFDIKNGLYQGAVNSPILFSIYTSDLVGCLTQEIGPLKLNTRKVVLIIPLKDLVNLRKHTRVTRINCSNFLDPKTLTNLIEALKEIYPTTKEHQRDYQLANYLSKVKFVMHLFVFMYMLLIWSFNLFAVLQYAIAMAVGRPIEQFLPYHVYLPWEWHNTPWYYVLNATEILAGYTAASGFIASDLLLCAIVSQICMHFDYINRKVAEYSPKGGKDDLLYLNRMVEYHQKVLHLTNGVNSAFGVSLLFNFATSSFIICFVGVQITSGVFNLVSLKFTIFLISSLFQVYLICYYGQKITLSSENIAVGLYNQIWYENASTSYKKTMIFMMSRAQKPVQLKATVALPISLRTFTEIGQLSYKFFTLLRLMYVQN
ncbi:odorant receptor 85c-like [Eupeodes corollae]|uniref:odorant receptor 85c-like n=1 Tax=Eupeodes corollae TaxID=290404 RepID=UPI002490298B|nr:odorant receptor 85c-like [Eupeodes corollae]